MNFKKKSLILSICLIISIQILLLINNRQKSSFRYLIWNIQEVSIGKIICISYISGSLMSYILSKVANNNIKNSHLNNIEENETNDSDYSINRENYIERDEIPPERDLRETQPTISVNYRIVKENAENESKDRKKPTNSKYQDDWSIEEPEW